MVAQGITAIETDQGLFRAATPLIFNELTLLHAGHCPLARLNIQANKLIELKINGSSPLSIQTLIAPSLEVLHCSNLADTRFLVGLTTLKKLRLNDCQQMRE